MLTNIKLLLKIGSTDTSITVIDRYDNILQTIHDAREILLENKIDLPNTLILLINNPTNSFVQLQDLWLGGIKLPKNILEQVGNFTDTKSNSTYTTYWTTSGKATINFHSNDFIQYHLINGNKFYKIKDYK